MKRIDTPTRATDLFGPGKHGFKDGDPVSGDPATVLNAEWFNAVQEEVAGVIEGAGLALEASDRTQLIQAVRRLNDSGTFGGVIFSNLTVTVTDHGKMYSLLTNTFTVTLPPLSTVSSGFRVTFHKGSTEGIQSVTVSGNDRFEGGLSTIDLFSLGDVLDLVSHGGYWYPLVAPADRDWPGIVRLASPGDTIAGTETRRAVTPAALQSRLTWPDSLSADVLSGGTANDITVGAGAVDRVGLVVRAIPGQTAGLQTWSNADGVALAGVSAAGVMGVGNFSGTGSGGTAGFNHDFNANQITNGKLFVRVGDVAPAQRGIVVMVPSGQTSPLVSAAYHGASSPTFQVLANGDVQNTNNSYGAISDANLKHHVADAAPKLDELRKIRVVNYILKDDPRQLKQIGVIAQELENIWPGLIEEVPVIERRQKVDEHGEPVFETVGQRQQSVAEIDEKEMEEVKQIDGRWVRRRWREEVTIEKPVFEVVGLYDEDGAPLGEYRVPVFEDVVEPVMEDVQIGSVKSVKYSVLVPILVKALQELAERVDAGGNQAPA